MKGILDKRRFGAKSDKNISQDLIGRLQIVCRHNKNMKSALANEHLRATKPRMLVMVKGNNQQERLQLSNY